MRNLCEKVLGSRSTCCKLLSTTRIVADVWFVSSVGALVYLQDTQTKLCSKQGATNRNML